MNSGLKPVPTILVADDMQHNREMLAAILRAAGYRVALAADGEEALELLATGPIDMALLDVMMPGRGGMDVCREIRSNLATRTLPVLLITGLNGTEDRLQGIESGANDFLTKPIRKEELLARVKSLLRIKHYGGEWEHIELFLNSLVLTIEAKDRFTQGRANRLAKNAVVLGKRIGLPDDQLIALARGAIVHDVGKIGIPDSIFQKAGSLNQTEWQLVKTHPEIGERICKPLQSFDLVLPIIRHHHEKLDGSGYPDGLKGGAIPITAKVLTAVDIYDALTSDRSYRKAVASQTALDTMREESKKGWWDTDLTSELQALIQENSLTASDNRASSSWG